mmetsp:Transcript_96392/g.281683  ORF Transcript_96392/g.281683 Transcript_96392/m.281683 type:complete len:246 (-) Transcript_96392:203-940(-)
MLSGTHSAPNLSRAASFVNSIFKGTRASSSYMLISLVATSPLPEISFSFTSRVSMAMETADPLWPQSALSDTQTPFLTSHVSSRLFSSSFRRLALPLPASQRFFFAAGGCALPSAFGAPAAPNPGRASGGGAAASKVSVTAPMPSDLRCARDIPASGKPSMGCSTPGCASGEKSSSMGTSMTSSRSSAARLHVGPLRDLAPCPALLQSTLLATQAGCEGRQARMNEKPRTPAMHLEAAPPDRLPG